MADVTIITPSYNCKSYIGDAIKSVIAQTYKDWEMIIVDDGSKDKTVEYLKENFDDERIKIVQNDKNIGAAYSRNKAINMAKTRFIAFLDADDIWEHDKLEKQITLMNEKCFAICHTNYSFINSEGKRRKGRVRVDEIVSLKEYLKTTQIGFSTAVIDVGKVGKIRMANIGARQDALLWIQILGKGFVSHGIDEDLVRYRVRGKQITSNKIAMVIKTLRVYLRVKKIPKKTLIYYWLCYIFNAIMKRFRR